jgi:hypothetical protein
VISSNPKFDQLKAEWERKLEESGFVDIEKTEGSRNRYTEQLTPHSRRHRWTYSADIIAARESLFAQARQFLIETDWRRSMTHSKLNGKTWNLYLLGYRPKEIARMQSKNPLIIKRRINRCKKRVALEKLTLELYCEGYTQVAIAQKIKISERMVSYLIQKLIKLILRKVKL